MRLAQRYVAWGTIAILVVAAVHFVVTTALLSSEQILDSNTLHQVQPIKPPSHEEGAFSAESSVEETLGIIHRHLAVRRKELAISQSKSHLSKQARDQLLYDELKKDTLLAHSDHIDRLVHIASLLRDEPLHTNTSSGKPAVSQPILSHARKGGVSDTNQSVVARVAVTNLPPPEVKVDDFIVNITLTDADLQELRGALVRRRNSSRPHVRRARGLELYREAKDAWQVYHNHINQYELYKHADHNIDTLLRDLSQKTIVGLHEISDLGTQLKFVFKLNYGGQALFKPMRISKDVEANPNHYMYDDFERHHAEIAAFHLDRALNFRRVSPAAGRYVNITYDIRRFASKKLKKTFYNSPANNVCFYGICDAYCDSGHAVCGHPHVVEGSMSAWLPDTIKRKHWENPWAQSYSAKEQAEWEYNPDYCDKVKNQSLYATGRRLIDVMDMGIFDFLSGNKDRHHYHTLKTFGNYTFTLFIDNGRGFGRYRHDEVGLLAPVQQCCMIRASTLDRLVKMQEGPNRLSTLMEASLRKDILAPILNPPHLEALDRRVTYILQVVHECGKRKGFDKVVVDDGF